MNEVIAARLTAKGAAGFRPKVAVVLGSGLGGFADDVEAIATIPYGELPDFPVTGVGSHAGQLVLGHVGPTPVAVLQGRAHGLCRPVLAIVIDDDNGQADRIILGDERGDAARHHIGLVACRHHRYDAGPTGHLRYRLVRLVALRQAPQQLLRQVTDWPHWGTQFWQHLSFQSFFSGYVASTGSGDAKKGWVLATSS